MQALEENFVDEEKWQKYKKDLLETKENLREFVKSRSVNIMVPIGKKALIRGTLQHTNEVTVSHGASYFSDVSSTQAIELLEKRMKVCDERLLAIKKEKDLFTWVVIFHKISFFFIKIGLQISRNKIKLPEDVFVSSEGREIIEEYNDQDEKVWRRKHIESVKMFKQREAEERQKRMSDVNIDKIFEDFELMEELADELDNLDIDDDDKLSKVMSGEMKIPASKKRVAHNQLETIESEHVNANVSESEVEKLLTLPIKYIPEINNNDLIAQNNQEIVDLLKTYRCKIKDVLKNVKKDDERNVNLFLDLIELKDDIEDDIRKMNDDEEYSDSDEQDSDDEETASIELKPEERKRKVRFSASLEDVKMIESKSELYNFHTGSNTIQMHFKHSEAKFSSQTMPGDDTIANPADIYKIFQKTVPLSPATKSILKHTTRETKSSAPVDEKPVKKVYHSDNQVIGDVVEHRKEVNLQDEVIHIASNGDAPKKVSKFKQMRLKS